MLVKITQPGWERYNDVLYGVMFEDGVSTQPLTSAQALQLGAMMNVVEVAADGTELGVVNPAHDLVKNLTVSAEVVVPMARDSASEPVEVVIETTDQVTEDITNTGDVVKVYKAEELQAIAAEFGIGGLREIGVRLKVKNTSINGLIREIMNAQNPGAQV